MCGVLWKWWKFKCNTYIPLQTGRFLLVVRRGFAHPRDPDSWQWSQWGRKLIAGPTKPIMSKKRDKTKSRANRPLQKLQVAISPLHVPCKQLVAYQATRYVTKEKPKIKFTGWKVTDWGTGQKYMIKHFKLATWNVRDITHKEDKLIREFRSRSIWHVSNFRNGEEKQRIRRVRKLYNDVIRNAMWRMSLIRYSNIDQNFWLESCWVKLMISTEL